MQQETLALGLMSGTSGDGVDAILLGIGALVAKHGVTAAALGGCQQNKPMQQALERSVGKAGAGGEQRVYGVLHQGR